MAPKHFRVSGRPVAQPRTATATNGHRYTPDNGVKAFRNHIAVMARLAGCKPVDGRVTIEMVFTFARPKSHFTKYGVVKKGAPEFPGHKCGDTDNLAKAVKDALTGIAYHDDTQVCEEHSKKDWGALDETFVRLS
jgi:Holliday junction resolvase RusA-like endonuclease